LIGLITPSTWMCSATAAPAARAPSSTDTASANARMAPIARPDRDMLLP
jgi:hypothetical protein